MNISDDVIIFLLITSYFTSFFVQARWVVDDSSVNIAALSSTPVTATLSAPSQSTYNIPLVLPKNSLLQRSRFVFSLECLFPDENNSVSTALHVVVNGQPMLGDLKVYPISAGIELQTLYSLVAVNWFDEDLPLLYSFGSLGSGGRHLMLQGLSERSRVDTKLAAGEPPSAEPG